MTAKNTPAIATVRRLVASVSLATAMSGVMLANSTVSSPVAGAAAHSVAASAARPAMKCGPDCPWDGPNS